MLHCKRPDCRAWCATGPWNRGPDRLQALGLRPHQLAARAQRPSLRFRPEPRCAAFARAEVEARSRRTDARRWRARAASRSHPAGGAAAARPWQLYIPEAAYTKGQTPTPRPLFSTAACSAALQAEGVGARGGGARRAQYKGFGALAKGPKCNFREVDGEHAAAQRAFVPAGLPPVSSLRTYMAKLTW